MSSSSKAVDVVSKECKSSNSNSQSSSSSSSSIEIYVSNVVCSFSTKCHLNLRKIGLEGMHVEYERGGSRVTMRLRKPLTTALIYSSGKINCIGATSEADAYTAARRYCRILQRMNFKVRLTNYRVVNVLATCLMPFTLDVKSFADSHRHVCSYEPELNAGAHYRIHDLKSTLIIFNTGSINMTVPSVSHAQRAIAYIYPLLYPFRREYISPPPVIQPIECHEKIKSPTVANNNNNKTLPTIVEEKKEDLTPSPTPQVVETPATVPPPPPPVTTTQLKVDMPVFDNNITTSVEEEEEEEEISLNILDSHIEQVLNEAYSLHDCTEYFQPDLCSSQSFFLHEANLLVGGGNSSQSAIHAKSNYYYTTSNNNNNNTTSCMNTLLNSSQNGGIGGSGSSGAGGISSSNWFTDNVFDDFLP